MKTNRTVSIDHIVTDRDNLSNAIDAVKSVTITWATEPPEAADQLTDADWHFLMKCVCNHYLGNVP
jgi:hypothetical protein